MSFRVLANYCQLRVSNERTFGERISIGRIFTKRDIKLLNERAN